MMDDETSRTSLVSSLSRNTDDLYRTENQRLEAQLHDARAELYNLRRIMPFLQETNPERPSETFRAIATECADLKEERDKLVQDMENLKTRHRQELDQKDDALDKLKLLLQESQHECEAYKRKCQEYERELSEDESAYYRRQMEVPSNRGHESPKRRVRSRATPHPPAHDQTQNTDATLNQSVASHPRQVVDSAAAHNQNLRDLYSRMDGNDSESSIISNASQRRLPHGGDGRSELRIDCEANYTLTSQPAEESLANQTNAAATSITDYLNMLREYRSHVRTLYDQLRHTSNFFVQILNRLGAGSDSQIQLLLEKINQINFEIQGSRDLYHRVEGHSKQLENDLAAIYRSFEARRANEPRTPATPSAAAQNKSRPNNEEIEAMLKQKDDLIAGLTLARNELDNERQKLQADFSDLQKFSDQLSERFDELGKQNTEFDNELANRAAIIRKLTHDLQTVVEDRDVRINEHKRRIATILRNSSTTNNIIEGKVRDGAAKCGYHLPDNLDLSIR